MLNVGKKRDLLADKKELDSILERNCLSDEYLISTGRNDPRSSLPMASEWSYGICSVIDDIAEHWLYRAINAEQELEDLKRSVNLK